MSNLTEECFQRIPLPFAGSTQWVQVADDEATRVGFPGVYLVNGTSPAGSVWARNPVPDSEEWANFPPAGGFAGGHYPHQFNIIDHVHVPDDLAPGDYVLSWRWDTELTMQVWTNCADVRIASPAHLRGGRVAHPLGNLPAKARVLAHHNQLPQAQVVWRWAHAGVPIQSVPALAAGRVFFGTLLWELPSGHPARISTNSSFWALDSRTGEAVWGFDMPDAVAGGAILGDGLNGVFGIVYFAAKGSSVYAVNASTGRQFWRFDAPLDHFYATPSLAGNVLYVGAERGGGACNTTDPHASTFYAIDARTGNLVWQLKGAGTQGYIKPVVHNGTVYITASYGLIYAVNAETGGVVWNRISEELYSAPVIAGSVLCIGTQSGAMEAYDAKTGHPLWTYHAQGSIWAQDGHAVHEGVIYFGSDDHFLHAVRTDTGILVWKFQAAGPIESTPSVASGFVYFGSMDGSVYAVDIVTGKGVWCYRTGLFVYGGVAVANGTAYVGSYDGVFYALRAPDPASSPAVLV